MSLLKVMVTGVGGAAGIVCLDSFRGCGIPTLGVNCFPLSSGFKLADEFAVVPLAADPDYISRLFDLCGLKGIRYIFPTVDEELPVLALNRDRFLRIGVKIAVSETSVVGACLDKWEFFTRLRSVGLPVARTWLATGEGEPSDLVYPLISKPRKGRGSRGISIYPTEAEYRSQSLVSGNIVQEFAAGAEYTVDTLSDFTGKAIVAVPRRRIEIKGGVSWKGCTEHIPALEAVSKCAVEALGIIGPACLQAKVDINGKIAIFEVNPRIGGTTSLAIAAGVDIPALTIKLLENEEIGKELLTFRKLYVARYFADSFFEEDDFPGIADLSEF